MLEKWVQSMSWEDLLGKKMATHSSTLTWKIPGAEELGGLQPVGSQKSQTQLGGGGGGGGGRKQSPIEN